VNKNFAIDLIAEQPVSEVESRIISCDGGGGALGHPKVYINLVILLFFIQRVLLVNSYLEDYLFSMLISPFIRQYCIYRSHVALL